MVLRDLIIQTMHEPFWIWVLQTLRHLSLLGRREPDDPDAARFFYHAAISSKV